LGLKTNENNPVVVIENIFKDYSPNTVLNASSFSYAKALREMWKCSLIVEQETGVRPLVDLIAKNHCLIVNENNLGEVEIKTLDVPLEENTSFEITSGKMLYKGSTLDIKQTFTDLSYLITSQDIYYEQDGQDFLGLIKSDEISYQDAMQFAREIVEDDIHINLQLETIVDRMTADMAGVLKTNYHYIPTRICVIGTTMDLSWVKIGTWGIINSDKIDNTPSKIYLVIKKKVQVPFNGKNYRNELTLFEFDLSKIRLQIHEVPIEVVNTNYDEVLTDTDKLEEVPNASE